MEAAEYTTEGIARRFGSVVAAALSQNDTAAMMRATVDLGRLSTLIRVLWFGRTEQAAHVSKALAPLTLGEAITAGFLREDSDGVRAEVQVRPYESWWLAADFPRGPQTTDRVSGVNPAALSMASAVTRASVGDALDLGCGSGVQSLHLSTHTGQVTATDLSHRALRFAATTSALNGFDWELKHGDLGTPVAGRRFGLIVSANLYRDWGRPGDGMCAELARVAAESLDDGGIMQFAGTWAHVAGQPWEERIASWVHTTGCDVWALQTSVTEPLSYVEGWTDQTRKGAWLDWFELHQISAVGTGLISLRRSRRDDPVVHCDTMFQRVEGSLGAHIRPWFARQDWLREHRHALLTQRYAATGGLRLRQDATLTAPGEWHISRQVLALPEGLRWAQEVSPVVAAAVSACDGTVPLRDQIAKAAIAHEADPVALSASTASLVPQLVSRGFLVPVDA